MIKRRMGWRNLAWLLTALAALVLLIASVALGKTAGRQAVARAQCGTERWSIKTMSDRAASHVSLTPRRATVAALRTKVAPSTLITTRIAPVELTTYRIRATLVEFKLEADSDIHLVVADPSTGGKMIVEFPATTCLTRTLPSVKQKLVSARSAFVAACGQPSPTHFTHVTGAATIDGIGFWDFDHGQTGVAPNAIELHPVVKFTGICS